MTTNSNRALATGLAALALFSTASRVFPAPATSATLVEVRKIWDRAPHNAFTDLIHHDGRWLCVFREGKAHVSADGALRVLMSTDAKTWESAALLTSTNADLRDAKISVTPDGRWMLAAAGALHPPSEVKHRSMVWFSRDARNWEGPQIVGDPNMWLWRMTWHQGRAYSVGYDTGGERFTRLYASQDATNYVALVPRLQDQEYPNESAIVFLPDHRALCLLRRDGKPGHGLLGFAKPPYTDWDWKDLGRKIGGPALLRLDDGRLIAGVRLYDGKVRTALLAVDETNATAREILTLPSGGDCSYPGLVYRDGKLRVSYYSAHEGKCSIYLATVTLD